MNRELDPRQSVAASRWVEAPDFSRGERVFKPAETLTI
jgi:hypothetical protein